MERLTSTSSRGLAGWGNPTIPQSGFTLFLRVHSARNLAAVGRGSYCKLYLGNTEVVNGSAQAGASFSNLLADKSQQSQSQLMMQPPTHRVFRTKVLYTDQKSCPEWNEKLELHVVNPDSEILTIRVKNQLMLFCPAIGACAIPLANVRMGEPAEQWFPLHKGGKPAGHIRLQLLLKEKDSTMTPPVAVDESPMQRLIQQHCQQERERRHVQQNEDSIRRRQFEEQERMQTELRIQRQEAQERERTMIEEMAKMKAFQEQMQREEQAKVQAYLKKQMEHEEDWHADGLVQKMEAVKVEEAPEDVGKEPGNSNNYFADDVTASTSRRSSNSSGLKQSFSGSQGGSHRDEQVHEAVVLTNVEFGEVVSDALPSSDSSSDGDGNQRSRRKDKDRRKQHSKKKSRSTKDNQVSSPPLFPSHPETKVREEVPEGNLSSALAESSSSSEETSSSEEERRRRRRRRKEKKAKRKERRRRRKAKRKARRESDGYESSSSYSSSSFSSSSSSSTSSDDHHKRKARKHKKTKERARSYRESKASSIPRAPAPPHSNSYGPDLSDYAKGTNKYNQPPPAYARPAQSHNGAESSSGYIETLATQAQKGEKSPPGYIETLPPQPQQKRSMGEMISAVNDVTSILSNVASVATSVQQLAGGGNGGGGSNIPFAVPDMSQYLGGQDLSGMFAGQDMSAFVGQDFSGFTGDTTAQYF